MYVRWIMFKLNRIAEKEKNLLLCPTFTNIFYFQLKMQTKDEQDGRGSKDGIGIEEEVLVLDDRMERMILDESVETMIYR
jgi:hypothetical protein